MTTQGVRAGSLRELQERRRLLTKVGTLPVVVFWDDGAAYAIEDRCPHLGFPLHQGTVEAGLVTCHWHHARFDLVSGCTLDLWADDARGFDVEIRGDDVLVARPRARRSRRPPPGAAAQRARGRHLARRREVGARPARRGSAGIRDRADRRRVRHALPQLRMGRGPHGARRDGEPAPPARARRPGTRARARAHLRRARHAQPRAAVRRRGAGDAGSAGRPPRQLVPALRRHPVVGRGRAHARDRARRTRPARGRRDDDVRSGHRPRVHRRRPHDRLHQQGVRGGRASREGRGGRRPADARPPDDRRVTLRGVRGVAPPAQPRRARPAHERGPRRRARPTAGRTGASRSTSVRSDGRCSTTTPKWSRPRSLDALRAGADEEQVGRAIAYAAALRIVRFHVQNDHGDWDTVHHAFTAANGLHQALQRRPIAGAPARRGAHRAADQPRPVPQRARGAPPGRDHGERSTRSRTASTCRAWSTTPGTRCTASCTAAATRAEVVAALGHALLAEDAEFHWYQTLEAGVRQAQQWPEGSEEAALVLTGVARFLAAHTPTRRELPTVVRIATRLRRGEALYEGGGGSAVSAAGA